LVAKATLKIVKQVARTVIQLGPDIDEITEDVETALIAANLPIYQRGPLLVRPGSLPVQAADRYGVKRDTVAPALIVLRSPTLRKYMARAMDFEKYDARKKKWNRCSPPAEIADLILDSAGEWKFPAMVGLISTPTLRPDGSLLTKAGFDKKTRLYHVADPSFEMPPIPERPTKAEAREAIKLIDRLLNGFPFKDPVDRSVALAAILTVCGRGGFLICPLFGFSATEPGTGKSYLADLISTFITGRWCPVIAMAGKEERGGWPNSDRSISGISA
jgi:putative DNA primase/helicase